MFSMLGHASHDDESAPLFPDTENFPRSGEADRDTPMEEESSHNLPSFEVPQQLMESSMEDDTPRLYDDANVPAVPTYQVIEDGSQKGKEKLADSEGYTYTVKVRRANGNKVWTCSVRNKSMWCKASVIEKADGFTRGSQPHTHSAQLGAAAAVRISASVKKIAATEIFTSAAEIVNKVKIKSNCVQYVCKFVHVYLIRGESFVCHVTPPDTLKRVATWISYQINLKE